MGNSQPCKQHQPPLAPYGRAYPSVASLPSPRRFASACRGLRPLKNAWPTASDVYQGRGKPRRRQPNHLELNQTYAPPEGSLRVGQYGSRRSDRLCSSWTTAAACKSVRVERQRGGGSAATGAAPELPESPTQRGSGQSGGKPTLAPETRPGGRRGPILAAATVQPWGRLRKRKIKHAKPPPAFRSARPTIPARAAPCSVGSRCPPGTPAAAARAV